MADLDFPLSEDITIVLGDDNRVSISGRVIPHTPENMERLRIMKQQFLDLQRHAAMWLEDLDDVRLPS